MRAVFFAALAAVMFCGCAGYQLGAVKPKLMTGVQTLAIPSFRNLTLEPRIEVLLANAVIKQFQQDGTYKVTGEKDADAILQGTLVQIIRRPARSVRGNVLLTREYTLLIKVRYQILNRATGALIDERDASGQTSFFVSGGSESIAGDVNQDERQALPLAAEDMAVHLVSQISEGW